MSKNKKDNEVGFKELMSTPRGKAIVFFGAYLLFFIILAVMARVGGASNGLSNNKKYETGSPLQFSLASIESSNYKFNYEMVVDGTTYLYQGIRTVNNEMFTFNESVEYYSTAAIYFVNNSGVWINTENPYILKEFIDVQNISTLIEKASYVSKTEYDSGKNVYSFAVSSATISKLLSNSDLDVEEVPNELLISTNADNYVNEVKFILNSYCVNKGICNNSMVINLQYESFGQIEEIISPLNS